MRGFIIGVILLSATGLAMADHRTDSASASTGGAGPSVQGTVVRFSVDGEDPHSLAWGTIVVRTAAGVYVPIRLGEGISESAAGRILEAATLAGAGAVAQFWNVEIDADGFASTSQATLFALVVPRRALPAWCQPHMEPQQPADGLFDVSGGVKAIYVWANGRTGIAMGAWQYWVSLPASPPHADRVFTKALDGLAHGRSVYFTELGRRLRVGPSDNVYEYSAETAAW